MRKIFKYEALGNDYIVIDPRNLDVELMVYCMDQFLRVMIYF